MQLFYMSFRAGEQFHIWRYMINALLISSVKQEGRSYIDTLKHVRCSSVKHSVKPAVYFFRGALLTLEHSCNYGYSGQ